MRTMVASLLSIIMMISSVKALCSNDETLALLAFKAGMVTDPTGALANWSEQSTDCCTWNGIVCNATTGSITAINLSNSSLSGTAGFNSTTSLSTVSSLDLSYNNFSGSLPKGISQLSHLSFLSVPCANPTSFVSLYLTINLIYVTSEYMYHRNVESRLLQENYFTGSIPSEYGQLKNLTYL